MTTFGSTKVLFLFSYNISLLTSLPTIQPTTSESLLWSTCQINVHVRVDYTERTGVCCNSVSTPKSSHISRLSHAWNSKFVVSLLRLRDAVLKNILKTGSLLNNNTFAVGKNKAMFTGIPNAISTKMIESRSFAHKLNMFTYVLKLSQSFIAVKILCHSSFMCLFFLAIFIREMIYSRWSLPNVFQPNF